MAEHATKRRRNGIRLPTRRVLAIDAGTRRVKLLLMHSDFGRLRVLRHEMIDLRTEGLVSGAEVQAHLREVMLDLGHPPLAIILPEHLSNSHVIDLPAGPETEVDRQIGDEAIKLSGVSESHIVYDFARLESATPERQQFWVTLCREENIRGQIAQLGIEHEDICEVTTAGNALITAHRMASPSASKAVLVHLGAQTTVVAGVLGGQGAFSTSIQMGGDFLTRAIARSRGISEEEAETLKRSENLLKGPKACPELIEAVGGWADELKRQLKDAFKQNPAIARDERAFEVVWSGGSFLQPGLLEHLTGKGLAMRPWPEDTVVDGISCPPGFEVAFGASLQALGYSSQPISLLPDNYRAGWHRRLGRQRLELASLLLVILCGILLGIGTWGKLSLIRTKEALRQKVDAAQESHAASEALTMELLNQYAALRPILASQQRTKDTLRTLALLQETRTNRNLWYLIVADQQTYFSLPPMSGAAASNRASQASINAGLIEPARLATLTNRFSLQTAATNTSPAKPGYIAELCVPGEPEAVRKMLQDLVDSLKQNPLLSQADLLSEDLRRNLADPKLLTSDRHYVVSLTFANSDFYQPVAIPSLQSTNDFKNRKARAARAVAPLEDTR